jgi:hypothetical protein
MARAVIEQDAVLLVSADADADREEVSRVYLRHPMLINVCSEGPYLLVEAEEPSDGRRECALECDEVYVVSDCLHEVRIMGAGTSARLPLEWLGQRLTGEQIWARLAGEN